MLPCGMTKLAMTAEEVQHRITYGYGSVHPRPHITLDATTFTSTKQKARFIDAEYGEWWARADSVVRGSGHQKRFLNAQILSAGEVQHRITNGHNNVQPRPFLTMVEGTYQGPSKPAQFIDAEYGAYSCHPKSVLEGSVCLKRMRAQQWMVQAIELERDIGEGHGKVPPRPHIRLRHETYRGYGKPATFVDDTHGEWVAPPASVRAGANHPMRNPLRKRTAKEVEASIQATRPWLSLDYTTYKSTGKRARFIDGEYGEWWAVPSQIIARPSNHPQRFIKKLKVPADEINRRLREGVGHIPPRPHLQVIPDTFQGWDRYATFMDTEHGEWVVFPNSVLKGANHPARGCSSLEGTIISLLGIQPFHKVPKRLLEAGLNLKPDFELTATTYLEVDGLYHHSERVIADKWHHFRRREHFEKHGYSLVQIRQDELQQRPEVVKSMLLHVMGKTVHKLNARRCKLTSGVPERFFEENHLTGYAPGKAIGLQCGEELVAALSYKMVDDELHIVRFCNKVHHSVAGGFSKLLNRCLKAEPSVRLVVCFVDLRHESGRHLIDLGFVFLGSSLGWKWTDGQCTFETPAKTRYRIFDAGLARFHYITNLLTT